MTYHNIQQAVFTDRPNRFIAHIEIDGRQVVCHVKNTGRCKELLIPGASVFVQDVGGDAHIAPSIRKTQFDMIAVGKGERLINIDSSAPNKVFAEWVRTSGLFQDVTLIRPEFKFGASRFDFYMEADSRRILVEVKGATLEENGVARFPDAPTERGVKHLRELISAVQAGYDAYAVFIVQMKDVRWLEPNWAMHEAFGKALRDARDAGVHILAVDCVVTEDSMTAADLVEVRV